MSIRFWSHRAVVFIVLLLVLSIVPVVTGQARASGDNAGTAGGPGEAEEAAVSTFTWDMSNPAEYEYDDRVVKFEGGKAVVDPSLPSWFFHKDGGSDLSDMATDVACDSKGNSLAVGSLTAPDPVNAGWSMVQAYMVKLAAKKPGATSATVLWEKAVSPPDYNEGDNYSLVCCDPEDNFFVVLNHSYDLSLEVTSKLLKVNGSSGSTIWERDLDFYPLDLCCDGAGNPVMVSFDIISPRKLVGAAGKYDGRNGNRLWYVIHDAADGDNELTGVSCDRNGDVLAAGYWMRGENRDCLWVKFREGDGEVLWSRPMDSGYDGDRMPEAIACDPWGDAAVVGSGFGIGKISGSSGDVIWQRSTTGHLSAVTCDRQGYFFAVGKQYSPEGQVRLIMRVDQNGDVDLEDAWFFGELYAVSCSPAGNYTMTGSDTSGSAYGDFYVENNFWEPAVITTRVPANFAGKELVGFQTLENPNPCVRYMLSPDGVNWYVLNPFSVSYVPVEDERLVTRYFPGYVPGLFEQWRAPFPSSAAIDLTIEEINAIATGQLYVRGYFEHKGDELDEIRVLMQEGSPGRDRYYFAEGTCRPGFETYFCIQNPGEAPAQVRITYMKGDSTTSEQYVDVAPHSRSTVAAKGFLGEANDDAHDFSAAVESVNGEGIIAERAMYFNYGGAWTGGHCKPGARRMATTFYFAEGTCRPGFETYFCIQNADVDASDIMITFVTGSGEMMQKNISVAPRSRLTLNAREFLGEGNDDAHDFSTLIEVDEGGWIIAERAMYFNYGGAWSGGHDVIGERSPQAMYFFAEGTCRPGFDPYLCIANPATFQADVKITYMKGDGTTTEQNVTVNPRTRFTVAVKGVLGEANDDAHDFSAKVETTNNAWIVAERSMYFDYNGAWKGGHCVTGAVSPQAVFYFAEGTCRPGFETYLCIQNPGEVTAQVKLTYMTGDGSMQEQNLAVPAHARTTVQVKGILGEANDDAHDFSTRVETTNNTLIIAERPMYFNYGGAWDGGHDVVGCPP